MHHGFGGAHAVLGHILFHFCARRLLREQGEQTLLPQLLSLCLGGLSAVRDFTLRVCFPTKVYRGEEGSHIDISDFFVGFHENRKCYTFRKIKPRFVTLLIRGVRVEELKTINTIHANRGDRGERLGVAIFYDKYCKCNSRYRSHFSVQSRAGREDFRGSEAMRRKSRYEEQCSRVCSFGS